MNVTAVLDNGQSLTFTQKPKYRLLHLHEIAPYKSILELRGGLPPLYRDTNPPYAVIGDGKAEGGPSVIPAYVPEMANGCAFTRQWQYFSFELLKLRVAEVKVGWSSSNIDALARRIFAALYKSDRFQSNNAGSDIRHDWVNGTNSDKEDIRLYPIFTAHNEVEVIGKSISKFGMWYTPVHCFNQRDVPPLARDVYRKDLRIMWAYIETRIVTPAGKREVRDFDLVGVSKLPVFVLANGTDRAYLSTARIAAS